MRRTRSGRPSLIGTAARTAVIAGTATAVSASVATSRRQRAHQQAAAQQTQIDAAVQEAVAQEAAFQPQPQVVEPAVDMVAQLQQLAELHQMGVLSDDEFEAAKAKLLAG
jgi:hypothetical protein